MGRKEWPERVYEDPALPAYCALNQAATAGGAPTPGPAPCKFAPGALRLPKHAEPGNYPFQPPRGKIRAQEPGLREADVRWELEAAGKGLSPRRTAAGQSPQDIYPQLCGPRPAFYRPWGTEDQVVLLEDM